MNFDDHLSSSSLKRRSCPFRNINVTLISKKIYIYTYLRMCLGCMGMAMDVAMCVKIVSSFQVQEQSDQPIKLKLNYKIYFCARTRLLDDYCTE